MSKRIKAIRGMNDILPQDSAVWQYLESTVRQLLNQYSYGEIRLPIVEYTDLFKRSIGEVTDIVEKEMYTFLDRNQESLTLRPEGTAGCVRAGEEHGLNSVMPWSRFCSSMPNSWMPTVSAAWRATPCACWTVKMKPPRQY